MKTLSKHHPLLALSLTTMVALAAACDEPDALQDDEFGAGEVEDRCVSCGIKFNTNHIGAHVFDEISRKFNVWHGKVMLLGVHSPSRGDLEEIWVTNGQLYARKNGLTYNDKAFLGSTWKMKVDMGGATGIINAQMVLTQFASIGANRVYTFQHTYALPGGDKPVYNCGKDTGAPGNEYAMILTEDIDVDDVTGKISEDAGAIYLGCLSGGVGKAAAWGYPAPKVGLTYFEAAIRMVRADYCGDGTSFTIPGNPVEIRDIWGYNDFVDETDPNEAIWGKAGARCVGTPRHDAKYPDAATIQQACLDRGATPPKLCKDTDTLATYGGYFWTKNP